MPGVEVLLFARKGARYGQDAFGNLERGKHDLCILRLVGNDRSVLIEGELHMLEIPDHVIDF